MSHTPTPEFHTPWVVEMSDGTTRIIADNGDCIANDFDPDDAYRIVACVNACKDIETKYLNEFPDWKLAVAHMARPGDVANLILSRDKYMKALQRIIEVGSEDFVFAGALKVVAEEALK